MEVPFYDIESVVLRCTAASPNNPDSQREAIEKYYTADCEFNHPLATVLSGQSSRDTVLRVYQWYRIMSPTLELTIDERVMDEARNIIYLQVTQTFHIRWSPFKPKPARLLVKIHLVQDGQLWFIKRQEDFYQPEDLLYLTLPPLAHVVHFLKRAAGIACTVNAIAFQSLGFWRTDRDKDD
ncbi:hypothetical protein EXIGLDRAFT_287273 [Exidia glandulosa HHB12029]|uniref:SigF-like NTF2-like domain-containing protein n=1 Tax=Exidia glandulosa HHB12029 TaxID=1314781 RepID=A0A165M608_EXIGL|nr:hypothetical protein EXIGLDRAFT_287273 [Exidia glandulosa HHB12029]